MEAFEQFDKDVTKIVRRRRKKIDSTRKGWGYCHRDDEYDGQSLKLMDFTGEKSYGRRDRNFIGFNGDDTQGLGYESFFVSKENFRKAVNSGKSFEELENAEWDEDSVRLFNCTKTAHRPYDLYVQVAIIRGSVLGVFYKYSSDGDAHDWMTALMEYIRIFGTEELKPENLKIFCQLDGWSESYKAAMLKCSLEVYAVVPKDLKNLLLPSLAESIVYVMKNKDACSGGYNIHFGIDVLPMIEEMGIMEDAQDYLINQTTLEMLHEVSRWADEEEDRTRPIGVSLSEWSSMP